MKSDKIYLVVSEEIGVDDGIEEKWHFAFSSREKALVKFNSLKKTFEHYWKEESSVPYTEEIDTDYYCIYESGSYCMNYSTVYITVLFLDEECDNNA
jgi:hypothetical protein